MKRLLACAVFLLPGLAFSQGIRKNFTEMTTAEKTAYNGALTRMYNSNPDLDLVQSMENDFWNYYDDIYGDLSGTPCEAGTYLPWNRMYLWEMDNALQRRNPRLTVPYWDFTTNTSPTDSLFTFLNQYTFPSDWYVNWYPGGNPLPTTSQVSTMQNSTKYCDDNNYSNSYSDQMVFTMDAGLAYWIGGSAAIGGDPMYSVYHASLDRLWQQWLVKQSSPPLINMALDRYDGVTTSPYLNPIPYVTENSTLDSRTMGIFYSNNDTATLDGGYSVTNTYMTPEFFSYPKQIVVGNFSIPSGKSAVLVTKKGVTINAGFHMISGSGSLEIDVGTSYYDSYPLSKTEIGQKNPFNQNPSQSSGPQEFSLVRSAHGFTARVWLQDPSEVQGYVMSIDGKIASRLAQGEPLEPGYHDFPLNVPQGGSLYIVYFRVGNQTYKQMLPKF